jgi:hypothetical protein
MSLFKKNWKYIRVLLFWIVGLMNTVLIRPEDVGTWKNYVGFFLIGLAIADSILILINLIKTKKAAENE